MARTQKRIFGPGLLTNVAVTKKTVDAGTRIIIRHFRINNTSAAPATITMSIGVDAAGTQICTELSIPAKTTRDEFGLFTLEAGEILQALAGTTNVINLSAFGDEITLG